jgi:hypothetical protein
MERKIKFLISLSLIVLLLFPKSASADILGTLDIFESQLNAIEEFTGVPMNAWIKVLILYVLGLITFIASGSLLNWVLKLPLTNPEIISLSNDFVTKGWAFTAGLVNMGIILILLMIAFGYILKIETFAAKQTFVKLVIIALLINFSLVFVKALFDISNILYLYILHLAGSNFLVESFNAFTKGLWYMIITIGGNILAVTAPLMIPPTAPWTQLRILITWLTGAYLFIPTWIYQLAIAFMFSFLFLLLFFLFSARIAIIWILAVLSPWAFVCYVLPQTRKYWNQWLKWLLDWMFFGIVILLLLVLGLKSIPSIETPWFIWVGSILPVPGYVYYYFFLFVFLLIVIYLLRKKFMPEFAQFLIDQSKTVGGVIWTRGLKPMARVTGETIRTSLTRSERIQRLAQREALLERKGLVREIIEARPVRRAIGRAIGPAAIEARKREISKFEDEAEKIKTPELLESKFLSAISDEERIGYLSAAIKKGGPFRGMVTKYVNEAIAAAALAKKIGAVKEAERITRALLTENWQNNIKTLERIGFENPESKLEELIKKAKGDEIKEFDKRLFTSPRAMELINKFWHGGQVEVGGREFGEDFLKPFQEMVNKKQKEDPEWYAINNPRLYRYLTSGAARSLGIGLTVTIPRERLREIELLRDRPDLITATKERRETIKKIEELERKIRAGGPPEELEKTKTTLENLRKTLEGVEETLVKEEPKLKDLWEEEKARKKRGRV